ncbi:serine protease [Pseudaminobacter arsenicus]|uniref:Serine protease n=1 Tax=Borborobacter arsenicus TaxID=1851146 RepID=A0A432VAA5_9HYPH|nr:serine protease [Pseudaminobacter arsenicus]RUM99046.1 serine protease [Pseudaminobacter arsenicus]
MKWLRNTAALVAVAAAIGFPLAAYNAPAAPAQASPTVKVLMASGHGSGVHIGNGFVITAGHVTEGYRTVTVRTQDGKERDGEVLWYNHASDVSLVHVTSLEAKAAALSCAPTSIGDAIRIEGNPSAVEFAVTWGKVSAFGKTCFENLDGNGQWRVLVTLDATAAPGVSGGPVYDGNGYTVRGILVSGMVTTRGTFAYTYMVPSTEICRVLGRA